jgi:hypothetical protein
MLKETRAVQKHPDRDSHNIGLSRGHKIFC